MDKENYILYKFYKYNKVGQSFNVKEEIYGQKCNTICNGNIV